ncbi:MAG: glycoside hydrolase N-terminal domain-containing protein, partial [Bacteroidales bacterium]|nr:glycoside hydrolase N-terminal domain-containing protein [Bacteroidales bacterium]
MKYLLISILSLLALQLGHNVLAQKLEIPERGFISTSQGETWEEGLLCGNGTIGANIFSQPEKETIIFTHERLFLPKGEPYMPPEATGKRLFEIRSLIEKGLYRQATELAADLSGQSGFMYHDPFVPAFDMKIETEKEGQIEDYMRSVDFQTGEATVHWADDQGVFERKMFVSRADSVAVLLMTAPRRGDLNCRITLEPRKPSSQLGANKLESSYQNYSNHISDVEQQAKDQSLIFRNKFPNAYPGSIHSLEGVARVMVKNGTAKPNGQSMVIEGADQVMVLLDINLIYKEEHSEIEQTQKRLAELAQDYDQLLKPHAQIHGELFNRMRLDLGGNQHDETSETLLASSTNEQLNMTLVEKLFDAARYNIISSTGELPPTLQGIWAGTYSPNWASDFTHNGNVPSAIASYMMGNMPELMKSYTSYIESIVPYLEINAEHMFGARGIVLPSRSTTTGFNNAMNPRFAGGFWVAGA